MNTATPKIDRVKISLTDCKTIVQALDLYAEYADDWDRSDVLRLMYKFDDLVKRMELDDTKKPVKINGGATFVR